MQIPPAVPITASGNFWSGLSDIYRTNNHVISGLINQPDIMLTGTWRDAANAAILAIRATGAAKLFLVHSNTWTGAHSGSQNWHGAPSATFMLTITDSGNNFAFDVDQYLDSDSSGGSDTVTNATMGTTRFVCRAGTNVVASSGSSLVDAD
jgi:endoglucanase